jgi:hypothetical protein
MIYDECITYAGMQTSNMRILNSPFPPLASFSCRRQAKEGFENV